MAKYEIIIGLEIHLQLKTASKMFCSCSNDGENQPVNTLVCPICLGHPGVLPTVNAEAVKLGIAMALALNCKINQKSKFDRKNYFYPDLPKGYQISQFDEPLAYDGHLVFARGDDSWRIGIERLHLEEDAAKNIHKGDRTLTDFNRGGTPLAEIVTRPDFRSPDQTREFLQELRLIARYLGVSDADMEKGHLRCDANISLRPHGDTNLYPKIEVKNLNSFKAVEKSLAYEVARQKELWDKKQAPTITETRGWNEDKQITILQRTKEGSADYRYFPEPDLPPLIISDKLLANIKRSIPELALEKLNRFQHEYDLSDSDARVLVNNRDWAGYFEHVVSDLRAWLFKASGVREDSSASSKLWQKHRAKLSKLTVNWITSELFGLLATDFKFSDLKISAENMAELISLVFTKKINSSAAQTILSEMFRGSDDDPSRIADRLNLVQIDDVASLEDMALAVIKANSEQAKQYQDGKETVLKYLVGQFMKISSGRANPQKAEEILKKILKS